MSETPHDRPIIITLHGIRTRLLKKGWQQEFETTEGRRVCTESLFYGFLPALLFLLPWIRKRRVEWFKSEWTRIHQKWGVVPSVIAHSFGTYLVAKAMRKYPQVQFDRIVFCGSIVPRDLQWGELHGRAQFQTLLNQYGGIDFWARIVQWFVSDTGSSGRYGFIDSPDTVDSVKQEKYSDWGHGDYFYAENYDRWGAFIEGKPVPDYQSLNEPRANRRPLIVAAILVLALIGLFLFKHRVPSSSSPQTAPSNVRENVPAPKRTFDVERIQHVVNLGSEVEVMVTGGDSDLIDIWRNHVQIDRHRIQDGTINADDIRFTNVGGSDYNVAVRTGSDHDIFYCYAIRGDNVYRTPGAIRYGKGHRNWKNYDFNWVDNNTLTIKYQGGIANVAWEAATKSWKASPPSE